MAYNKFYLHRLLINLLTLSTIFISPIFIYGCGSCGNDQPDNSETDGSGEIGEIDYFKESASLNGELPQEEIDKIASPISPLPNDITIETIITGSDIKETSYFVYKVETANSSSSTLNDDKTFNLTVPVGYEFFSLISMDGDIIGLIKYKKDDKYIANITLASENNSVYMKNTSKKKKEYDIGSLAWTEDYFRAQNSIFDVADVVYEEEGLSINYNNEIVSDTLNLEVVVTDTKSFDFNIESSEKVTFSILNLPTFCTFSDNSDNTSNLKCSPTLSDDGEYKGIYLWGVTENEKGHIEINLDVFKCDISLSVGEAHACAILNNCGVKCWGGNEYGQLGYGDKENRGDEIDEMGDNLPYVDLGIDVKVKSIASGGFHNCVILTDNNVKCWGDNSIGQLGLDDPNKNNRGDENNEMGDKLTTVSLGSKRTAKKISCGGNSSCAILDNNLIKCWGNPPRLSSSWPAGVGLDLTTGPCQPNQYNNYCSTMGDNLAPISLGSNLTPLLISSGGGNICVIFDNNSIKCWGGNNYGQLGLGDVEDRGDDEDELGDFLPFIFLGSEKGVTAISPSSHTCVILYDGNLKCWGNNEFGQLGIGDTNARGDNENEMGDILPLISIGSNRTVIDVTTGVLHTCAVLDDQSVKCWGSDFNSGDLGLGDNKDRGDEPNEMGDNLPPVNLGTGQKAISVKSNGQFTCVVLDNSAIKCWGHNDYGQLGLGDTQSRGSKPSEMGDYLPAVDLGNSVNIEVE